MNPTHRLLARLCLGLSNGHHAAFRNIAWASPGTDGHGHWQAMVQAGHARAVPASSSTMAAFTLTRPGAELALDPGETLPAHLFAEEPYDG